MPEFKFAVLNLLLNAPLTPTLNITSAKELVSAADLLVCWAQQQQTDQQPKLELVK